ncbi:nuclear transport factor 2 family protein [Sphingomonas sp. RP10(2022)]|uniref:Nuclear transport factor 2 family protein n=1 Tax=Sphingomonas liriopis TaxID=2949094 RepID=A0A9X2KNC9_9SPHN|nr:nuclear transport factor 2 family protein [Sphingomonas liriopis]MCP3733524.1 nuclear transport factor 2 family protein [Sphingomonas liriopis]
MSDLQTLLDERAIVRGLAAFARIVDGKRWDDLSQVFADDLTFDYGAIGSFSGIQSLRDVLVRFLDRCGATQHLIGSIVVDIEGDAATSRAYVQARHQGVGAVAGPVFDSNGEYVDRWERRVEGWRIVRRDASWAIHTGDPTVLDASDSDLR